MRRRTFLSVVAGAAGGASLATRARASTQVPGLGAPLRIRLSAGDRVTRLQAGDAVLDAASRTISSGSASKGLGSDVEELTGSPFLDVSATTASGATIQRTYPGSLFVQLRDADFTIINLVEVEPYVSSVLSAEMSAGWPAESLRAQAIAVRTYAERARMTATKREYDLNDDTSSQVYRGVESNAASFTSAVQDTAGKIVTFRNLPASVFYGSSCGGHTAASIEFTGQPSPEYLGGIADVDARGHVFCSSAPYFRWKNLVATGSMARIVDVPADQLASVTVAERWPDGRAKTIAVASTGPESTLTGRTFYSRAMAALGYKVIPSALFDIAREGDGFAVTGHGVGHGVGLCQWGARGRADAGMTAAQILSAYFPGTNLM